ncbi:MAG: cyanoglobin [Polyangiaceae bacterium]|nr:cyanoglobin [Polyangiaceae bacterium]
MQTPFDRLGGEAKVRAIAERFYDVMSRDEPALARLHEVDDDGRVARGPRDRFALFFIGWLGGPQTYMELHGHPRLRMRHARVPVTIEMRDAWVRAMRRAMDDEGVAGDVRALLDQRLLEVANMLVNAAG